jgi:hypothetical protein
MIIHFRFVVILCLVCGVAFCAQAQGQDKLNAKALEAAASYAQSLAQWGFIIIGGSLVLVLGNSHRWPKARKLRVAYLLFLLAWASLAVSIYFGTRVQQAHLAYLLVPSTTIEGTTLTANHDLAYEIFWMLTGLFFLGLWLSIYLVWSVISKEIPNARGES